MAEIGHTAHAPTINFLFSPVPPKWIRAPSDVNVMLGETVLVDCSAAGVPSPGVKWSKAGDGGEEFTDVYQVMSNFM